MKIGEHRWSLIMAYKKKGLTTKQLAKKTGINYQRLARVIRGDLIGFRPNEKRTLSRVLRTPQKELFKVY